MIGDRVRLTTHDSDGKAYQVDGRLAALAAVPDASLSPREPRPWPCLVRIPVDGGDMVVPYDVNGLIFLPEISADEADTAVTVSALRDEIRLAHEARKDLDEECARLTAELKTAHAQIAQANFRAESVAQPAKGRRS